MTLLRILRDPIWQAVGALVGVLAIFLAFVSRSGPSELAVFPYQTVPFSGYMLPDDRVKMLIKGLPSDINSLQATYFLIVNDGDKPLRSSDFAAPISIRSGDDKSKIVLLSSCSEKAASQCSASGSSAPVYAPMDWTEAKDGWQATPVLLNPTERVCVVVVSEVGASSSDSEGVTPPFKWDARIVGWQFVTYSSFGEYTEKLRLKPLDYFSTYVILAGAGVYWFMLLQGVFFLVVAVLAVRSSWVALPRPWSFARLWLVAALSITSAEILVSIFINEQRQAPIAWPLLAFHVGLCGYLLYRIYRSGRPGAGESADDPSGSNGGLADSESATSAAPR